MDNILILGATGQVGSALIARLGSIATGLSRAEADLAKPESLRAVLEMFRPDAIINASAYTQVDKAEEEEELANRVNGVSPGIIADFCKDREIPLIHYSTDYVFDGSGGTPWREEDRTNPLSAYGRTKLEGEQAIARAGGNYLIFRASWVYDAYGKNFVNTMLRLGKERETLRIVADQIGAPSYAPHLAKATMEALRHAKTLTLFPSGIYHLCNRGETSWHGFASAIFEEARAQGMELKVSALEPIATSEYPTPAKRPLNSRLDCHKIQSTLDVVMPDWRAGLKECMELKS